MMINKDYHIFGENIGQETLDQFFDVMKLDCVVKGAVMPDAHLGYVLNIGGVVATDGYIFPSFIGYDIGCGMVALKTPRKRGNIFGYEQDILNSIIKRIPCGEGLWRDDLVEWDYKNIDHTNTVNEIMKKGKYQIGTLGGGNHFIEIGCDEEKDLWIIIHSGSRGVGHSVATEYMKIAKANQPIDTKKYEEEFDTNPNYIKLKEKDLEKYEEVKGNYIMGRIKKDIGKTNIEGAFGLDVNSKDGKDYIKDMNFCLEYAEYNRLTMLDLTLKVISKIVSGEEFGIDKYLDDSFINRNHNHAELKDGLWIHRKGATHAEDGMMGVIPGNMRDGSFIVKGKGNPDSLYSSSHGAGRSMSRKEARENVTMDEFKETMKGIVGVVEEKTIDESPFAYKNIFEVMEWQKDLVDIIHHIKPIINIKG